eukprot:2094598-Amphidinium_carterae.1
MSHGLGVTEAMSSNVMTESKLVWLSEYDPSSVPLLQPPNADGARSVVKSKFRLPRGERFNKELFFEAVPFSRKHVTIRGLAKVTPSYLWDYLRNTSAIVRSQLQYECCDCLHWHPVDAHVVNVLDVFKCSDPLAFTQHWTRDGLAAAFKTRNRIFAPVTQSAGGTAPAATGVKCGDLTVRQMCELNNQEIANMLVLLLPYPMASLVLSKQASELVLFGRHYNVNSKKNGFDLRIFPSWPSDDWLFRRRTIHKTAFTERLHQPTFDTSAHTSLVHNLRRWSSIILDAAGLHRFLASWKCFSHVIAIGDDAETVTLEKDRLQESVRFLEVLASKAGSPEYEHSLTSVRENLRYSDVEALHSVIVSRELQNRSGVHRAMQRFVQLQLGSDVKALSTRAPTGSTVRRYTFAADMALSLYRQKAAQTDCYARYGWSDSSPLLGKDWCMNIFTAIRLQAALDVWNASSLLEEAAMARQSGMEWQSEEVQAAHKTVLKEVQTHVLLPSNVELGHADTAHKAAGFVFALALESGSRAALQRTLQTFRSFTTDMGVELKMASFAVKLADLLPPWWCPEVVPSNAAYNIDGETCDSDMQHEVHELLPNAVSVPGLLHVFHNLEADVDAALTYFPTWYPTLKLFSMLLCKPLRRRAVYNACIAGTQWASLEVMADKMAQRV